MFTPPSNVNFIDISKMMGPPQGTNQNRTAPTVDPKQIEDIMKQYSNPEAPQE
jgi:hypothetical protein